MNFLAILWYFIMVTLPSLAWDPHVCTNLYTVNMSSNKTVNKQLEYESFYSVHTQMRHFLQFPVDCFLSFSVFFINIIPFQQLMRIVWFVMADFKVACTMWKKLPMTNTRYKQCGRYTRHKLNEKVDQKKNNEKPDSHETREGLTEWLRTKHTFFFLLCPFVSMYDRDRVGLS